MRPAAPRNSGAGSQAARGLLQPELVAALTAVAAPEPATPNPGNRIRLRTGAAAEFSATRPRGDLFGQLVGGPRPRCSCAVCRVSEGVPVRRIISRNLELLISADLLWVTLCECRSRSRRMALALAIRSADCLDRRFDLEGRRNWGLLSHVLYGGVRTVASASG